MRRSEQHFAAKLVLITGGTSGIGLALAEELARLKAEIIVLADKASSVSAAIAQLSSSGHSIHGYACDIGIAADVADTCSRILEKHGPPDILINNAGYAIYRTFEQEDPDEVERLMSVNFAGAVRVTKVFLDGMVKRRSGHIVNIASISGMLPLTPNALYGAAKHGMMGWSRCIAPELARFGIDITVICPGRVKTNFFQHETYHTRVHRKETELTIPMEAVVEAILDAILRRKFIRYVPRYYGLLAWAYHALGPLAQRPFEKLMRSRVEDMYRSSGRK